MAIVGRGWDGAIHGDIMLGGGGDAKPRRWDLLTFSKKGSFWKAPQKAQMSSGSPDPRCVHLAVAPSNFRGPGSQGDELLIRWCGAVLGVRVKGTGPLCLVTRRDAARLYVSASPSPGGVIAVGLLPCAWRRVAAIEPTRLVPYSHQEPRRKNKARRPPRLVSQV